MHDTKKNPAPRTILRQLPYGAVRLYGLKGAQFRATQRFLLDVSTDTMLKPYRELAGLPAPGTDIGGWYDNFPTDWFGRGFAPGHCLGQWISALARGYAITRDHAVKSKLDDVVHAYAQAISPKFYDNLRYPTYTYEKLVLGLLEAHFLADNQEAIAALQATTDAALHIIPDHPTMHGEPRPGRDVTYTWDEPYTVPETMLIAYQHGLGERYLELGKRLLVDKDFFDHLAAGENVLVGKHAYSHVNALCSAVEAYLSLGSEKHLQAARNGFDMIDAQSYATGGWGPDELFVPPGSGELGESITKTHRSFETPCGSYAHMKLTRGLLCITGDSRYGDSMERIVVNTVLGAKPPTKEGRAFYYSDYHPDAHKEFHPDNCTCCAGSLPQGVCEYHAGAYFTDERGIVVNLYGPSSVNWDQQGSGFTLSQSTEYPLSGLVRINVSASQPRRFEMRFRIPQWAKPGTVWLRVNGDILPVTLKPGSFASVTRKWKDGDIIKLRLPMRLRLESVDDKHPDLVALVRGPLVLFALGSTPSAVTREQLLNARRSPGRTDEWIVQTTSACLRLRPFFAIQDETYNTYLQLQTGG
jgi:DUF1680 family protein